MAAGGSDFDDFAAWVSANPMKTIFVAGALFLVLFGGPKSFSLMGRMNPRRSLLPMHLLHR